MTVITAGNIPLSDELIEGGMWTHYRKKTLTKARRMKGPFRVETSEGPVTCQDGYLCIDARGYPYPAPKDEFEKIYEPA